MTKKEKLRRARYVKSNLARFVDIQDPYIAGLYASTGVNPDYVALNRLLTAKHELVKPIADLRAEGYGERAELEERQA
jgi:predicted transcriptional regulator